MLRRIINLFRRSALDVELDAELSHHVDALEADYRDRGFSVEEARRAARRDMGGLMQAKEAYRDQRGIPSIDIFWRDVRFAARSLRRTPGVAAAVVVTMAIGIGANATVFTMVNSVLLKPLPYSDPGRLVSIAHTTPATNTDDEVPSAPYLYFTYREGNRTFANLGLWRIFPATVTGLDQPEQVQALVVTSDVIPALGIQPLLGRAFTAHDDSAGGAPTVMLTYGYWQRRFGGAASVVGRRLVIDGQASDVIGVMPRRFTFLDRHVDLISPFQLDRSQVTLGRYIFQSLGRLKPGVTLADAAADLLRLVPLAIETFPPPPGYTREQFATHSVVPHVRPLEHEVVGDIGRMLWVLMGALGLVLLIACANVANLLLVRADGRQQELAVRAALGASAGRIARDLLIESVLLGIVGGAAGLAFAYGGLQILLTLGPANLPRAAEMSIDPRVLLFTAGISILSGVGFGLLPAIKYASPRIVTSLGGGGRAMSDSRGRHRARASLVIAQVAMALVLLVCSGLMVRTFQALTAVHPGFTRPDEVQMVHLEMPRHANEKPEAVTRMQQAIVNRLGMIPGVASVAFADIPPLSGTTLNDTVLAVEGKMYAQGQPRPLRRFEFISPGLFQTLGTPVVAGRDLTWTDLYDKRMVALVSQSLAREEWGSARAALGRRVRASPDDPWREIVGVVGDVRDNGMSQPGPPIVFFPALVDRFWSAPTLAFGSATFLIRTPRAGSESFLGELQHAVWDVDGNIPLAEGRTLGDAYRASLARTSFTLAMLAIAAVMGLLLGSVGIYGVIAYAVSQRSREIGIRMALGAQAAEVKRMFVAHAVRLAAVGVVAGAAAAAVATRLMSSLLFGVRPIDPATYAAMTSVVLVTAVCAAYLPSRRATLRTPLDAIK